MILYIILNAFNHQLHARHGGIRRYVVLVGVVGVLVAVVGVLAAHPC